MVVRGSGPHLIFDKIPYGCYGDCVSAIQPLASNLTDNFEPKELFMSRGETWRGMRKILSPSFSASKMKMVRERLRIINILTLGSVSCRANDRGGNLMFWPVFPGLIGKMVQD